MNAVTSVVVFLILILGVGGAVLFYYTRRLFREQKGLERGLKMIPLLIHLPPISDDTERGSRDTRDVIEETISKSQVLYDIIAGTIKKGFKAGFYGQRHFSFEIIGVRGEVNFYVTVPMPLLDVVQQAIVSAYPASRLEEVPEHNIFSPIGKISGTVGGELTLKNDFAYPIATYQDIKRDALQSILNALSTLDYDDGAGIQILIRPANQKWRKKISDLVAKKKKNGMDKGGGLLLEYAEDFIKAPIKPPEERKREEQENRNELSSADQAILESMEEKTRYPGFEVLIRVIASSNISQRARSIQNNIVSSFALFDAPEKNGFKFNMAKDIEAFTTSYIMRFFPPEYNSNILNSVELASIFHFPDQSDIPTTQLKKQSSKQVDGPRNVPAQGLTLGYNVFRGVKKKINLGLKDRRRHMYAVGQTGTGKTTFLENLALQDMLNGDGFAFIDPHGDVVERLMGLIPRERAEDVIYFNPSDMDYPLGLNLFEFDDPDQKDFLIQEAINMLYKLYDPNKQGMIGARFEHIFRFCALTIMSGPDGGTIVDIPKILTDKEYLKQKLKYVTDETIIDFWTKEMVAAERSNEFGDLKSWFISKFGAFLSNTMMRNIVGQNKSAFNLRDIMDNKKILLVNLSKGKTGELNSKLLGMIFVMKFQAAAMARADTEEDDRVDFCLYVDEFQNFSTDSFASILSEARKYRFNIIVANQFTTQLTEEIRDAVFGNIGTIVCYRVGSNDTEVLGKYFAPIFDVQDLQTIPNFNTVVRMLIGGVPTQPFSMALLPPLGKDMNKELAVAMKQLSAAKYGRPRAKVEEEIFARLRVNEPATKQASLGNKSSSRPVRPVGIPSSTKPLTGSMGAHSASNSPSGLKHHATTSRPSFLDEWLAKKNEPNQGRAANTGMTKLKIPDTSGPQQGETSYRPSLRSSTDAQPPQPTSIIAQPVVPTGSGSNVDRLYQAQATINEPATTSASVNNESSKSEESTRGNNAKPDDGFVMWKR